MKVYIVGVGYAYKLMYQSFGDSIVDSIEEADIIQFTGGSDVTPSYYGQHPHPTTFYDTHRDEEEAAIFEKALSLGKFMVGICRGGQFLNVMSGGSLYQDVDNHATHVGHEVIDILTNKVISVTSTHHQMMRKGKGGELIAKSKHVLSEQKHYMSQLSENPYLCVDTGLTEETEVVFYPETKCLCFQPHPEIVREGHPCREYFFEVLGRCYNGSL